MFNNMRPGEFVKAARDIFSVNKEIMSFYERVEEDKFAVQNVKEYVTDMPFNPDSALGVLSAALDNIDDVDNIEDDDVLDYANTISEYFDEFPDDEELDVDDADWTMRANLSSNLRRMFGLEDSPYDGGSSDWVAPATSGMGNSEPIIKTVKNQNELNSNNAKATSYNQNNYNSSNSNGNGLQLAESKYSTSSGNYNNGFQSAKIGNGNNYSSGLTGNSSYYSSNYPANNNQGQSSYGGYSNQGAKFADAADDKGGSSGYNNKSPNYYGTSGNHDDEEEEDYDDDDEDDDDDGDYDIYDDNDEDDDADFRAKISLNLMRATGMSTDGMTCVTDWTPPARSGLDNSSRLF